LSSLSASTASRNLRKKIAQKAAKKIHCSQAQFLKDFWVFQILMKQSFASDIVYFLDLDEDETMFLLGGKKEKDAEELVAKAKETGKQIILESIKGKQSKLFG